MLCNLKFSTLLALAVLILAASCNKPADSDTAETPTAAAPTGSMSAAAPPPATNANMEICSGCGKPESECTCADEGKGEALAAAPKEIKLADGTVVPVVEVAKLNADPKAYTGTYAIDGTVGEVFADKGRFMLVDCATAAACSDPGCATCSADMKVPVRIDTAALHGALPVAKTRVFVVADVATTETGGFELKVKEVREGEKTVCTVEAAAHQA